MKKVLSVLMAMLMVVTCIPAAVVGAVSESDFVAPEGKVLTSFTEYNVAPGVTEQRITTVDKQGNNQNQSYAAVISADSLNKTTGILAGYDDYSKKPSWNMRTVRDQAAKAEEWYAAKGEKKNIVFAMNGDYFDMRTGEPLGALVMNGTIVHQTSGNPYFAITKEGKVELRDGDVPLDDVKEAIGSPLWLIRGGEVVQPYADGDYAMPRAGVGITADGDVVFFESDGRQAPKSVGYTLHETALLMQSLGCVDALYLDGGGSATFCTKSEGTDELTVKNSPSDGTERKVSSSVFVYSDIEATGKFDHASIAPYDEIFTPKSEITFTALGVDLSGGKAELPEDGKFVLDESSAAMGTITDDGVFTANETEGLVKVNYVSDGKVCGSTEIELHAPDSIYFENDEISLGFEKESNLGLTVKYQERYVNYKDGDIIWTMDNEKMGTFNGNIFTSSDSESITGKIYATSAFDSSVSGTITAIIGKLPSIVWDFENPEDYRFAGSALTPDVENPNMVIKNYGRGVRGDAEIITKENGEVRHGTRALKIDYDLSDWNLNTDGICIGPMEDGAEIEGTPTGIGMWVYAPEGTPNFWLRMYYKDAAGVQQVSDITIQRKEAEDGIGGINWTGWKYVEGELKGSAPYKFFSGMTIRLMALSPAGNEHGLWTVTGGYEKDENGNDTAILNKKSINKTEAHGSIYVDNVQFVYGANVDDIDNPVIDNVQIGKSQADLVDISSDTVIESNDVLIQSSFHDVENKYSTDINFDNVNVYLDGKDVTAESIILTGDYMVKYYATLADGLHSVKILVRDGFNNETTETRYFTVKGGVEYPTVNVASETDKCSLNKDFSFAVTSNNVDKIAGVKAKIKLDNTIVPDASALNITYADGFDGTYTYNTSNGTLELNITGEAKGDGNKIATVAVKIPYNTLEGKRFVYRVLEGEITFTDPSITTTTFATANITVPIEADYSVSSDLMIVGGGDANLYVKNEDGSPAAGVDVYNTADNSLVGTTDENGVLTTSVFNEAVQSISVYAMKDEAYSFKYATQSANAACNAEGKPEHVLVNASENGSSAKNISWISNPLATQEDSFIQYALKADYEKDGETAFTQEKGINRLYSFFGNSDIEQNYVAKINTVKLTGLKGNSEYVFRVGDGKVWSPVKSFSTALENGDTNFFVFGDIQATDTTNISNLMKAVATDGVDYDFGIQTGDSIETASIYSHWDDILKVFSDESISDVDLLHVLGNHEFMGDPNADSSVAIYNLQNKDFYSVDYGNVHVAVINYAAIESNLDAALDWLVKDAAASNAAWKVVSMHVPPYNTNSGDSHKAFTEKFPKAAQEAGIDFVFSGHDHSYARTSPMTDLKIDEENGITYFICGSSGEKSYSVTVNPDYNFEIANNEYTSIYLSVSATDSKFTVKTYDVNGEDVVLYDSFTKEKKSECVTKGHSCIFDNGYLTCSVCGYTVPVGTHTGFVSDKQTGKKMYLIAGNKAVSKWQASGDDWYYFDENGLAVSGKVEIDGKEYTFGEDGVFEKGCFVTETVTMKDGTKKDVIRYYAEGGTYVLRWREIDGNLYFFSKISNQKNPDDGNMYRSGKLKVDVPAKASDRYFTFDDNGILILGAFENVVDADGNVEGTRYYWGDEYVTGDFEVQGVTYTFDEKNGYMQTKDISTCKVSLDSDTFAYTSKAISPAVTVFDGDELLAKKTNYKVQYKDNVDPGTASIVITGKPERGYTGSVTVNFTIAKANVRDLSISAISDRTYTGKELKPSVTVKNGSVKLVKDTDYTVTYKNNTNPGTATVTVKGIGNYTGSKRVKFKIIPGTVTAKAASNGYNKIKVTWNKQSGITGYVVYRSTSKTGEFKKIKTISGASTVSYVDTVSTGKTYYYKVVAYKTIDGTNYYGDYPAAVSAKAVPNAPAVKAASESYNKIKVTWNKQSGVTGYVVYRSTSKTSGFKKVKTLKGASSTSYIDSVSVGKTYYYKVVAYKTVDGTNYNSAYSAVVSAKGAPKAPTAKAASQGYNKIKISWNKQSDATGYAIYRSTSKTKGFKRLKTVNGASAASFIDTVNTGKTYYYKVFAFKSVNGKRYYSAASSIVSAKAVPSKTTRVKVSSPSSRKAEVSWSAVAGASGYEIYRSTKSGGTYTKVKTVSSSTRKYTEGALKGGSQYFYKVRAFTTVGGAKVYGAFSSVASAKIKK